MSRTPPATRLRCAIYTRKSTEEGLEQEFNSLDAQHEACAAYIASQAGLGWKALPTRYDDGGISGGTMERPALQELLSDIRQGKVDVVVVYKIDRLTRSLTDFARIVEVFDARSVSFVSVTQQFNTTTSMGRLTLNVLLSFAQFEREVTAERIRDKIAASKRKGMWMGGAVPLGYQAHEKRLVIAPDAAQLVRMIYRRYLELGSVRKLKEELDERVGSKSGMVADLSLRSFSRGHLYWLLSNPIYAGDIRHKDQVLRGQHEAIIDRDLWQAVQQKLKEQSPSRTSATNHASGSLLAGLLFDETGDRLTPSLAIKDGRRYRYYISQRLMQARKKEHSGWRLPAHELDLTVLASLRSVLEDQDRLYGILGLQDADIGLMRQVEDTAKRLVQMLSATSSAVRAELIKLVSRIDIAPGEMRIALAPGGFRQALGIAKAAKDGSDRSSDASGGLVLALPFELRRRGVEARLIVGDVPQQPAKVDEGLVDVISRARRWLHQLNTEGHPTIATLARQVDVDDGEISRILPLAFLAPDIVAAIIEGRQPVELTVRRLIRLKPLPACWTDQRHALGFDQS